jgi:drug/metabolite transporter (DMT)-like permease
MCARAAVGTLAATAFALVAFASNSLLCRLALGSGSIDASSFTTLRIASGAALLVPLAFSRRGGRAVKTRGLPWISAGFLFLYAAAFSFAYVSLSAGTGALLLFGAVQATMIAWAIRSGERFGLFEGVGLVAAIAGLVVLVAPGVRAPSLAGSALMLVAGGAWGCYSLRGRNGDDPLAATSRNFLAAVPFTVALSVASLSALHVSARGVVVAVVSGAITSGLGYVVWYQALRGLTSIRAAIVQLAVPALAALGGVAFLGEPVTLRLVVSGILILGGVALATLEREREEPRDVERSR